MDIGEYGIGLIVSDIDDCIVRASAAYYDLTRLDVLKRYNINSMTSGTPPLTLITGRSQPYVEVFTRILAIIKPCVCENGCAVFRPNEGDTIINPNIAQKSWRALEKLRLHIDGQIRSGLPCRIEPGKMVCLSVQMLREGQRLSPFELFERIKPLIDEDCLEATYSPNAVDITPIGINKGSGLAWLGELVNFHPRNMVGIGASAGDVPLLSAVGYSGAPGNACMEARKVAVYTSEKSNTDGVIDIIEHFLDITAREMLDRKNH